MDTIYQIQSQAQSQTSMFEKIYFNCASFKFKFWRFVQLVKQIFEQGSGLASAWLFWDLGRMSKTTERIFTSIGISTCLSGDPYKVQRKKSALETLSREGKAKGCGWSRATVDYERTTWTKVKIDAELGIELRNLSTERIRSVNYIVLSQIILNIKHWQSKIW